MTRIYMYKEGRKLVNQEKSLEGRVRRENTQKVILETLAVGGVLTLGMLAPNAMPVFGKIAKKVEAYQERHNMYRALKRLEEAGHIQIERGEGKFKISLTPSGREKLDAMLLNDASIKKQKRWDKNWRIVIYDIKEKRRRTRRLLSQTLLNAGFFRLQDSVWVSPYPCEELVALLKAHLKIGKDLQYIIAKHIEYDKPLRVYFDLK